MQSMIDSKKTRGAKKRLLQALSTVADISSDSDSDDDAESTAESTESTESTESNESTEGIDDEMDTLRSMSSSSTSFSSSGSSIAESSSAESSSTESSSSSSSCSSSGSACNSSALESEEESDLHTEEEQRLDDSMDVQEVYKPARSATRRFVHIIGNVKKRRRSDQEPVAKSSQIPLVLDDFKANDHDRFRRNIPVSPRTFDQLLCMFEDHPVFAYRGTIPHLRVDYQLAIALYRFGHEGAGISNEGIAQRAGNGFITTLFTQSKATEDRIAALEAQFVCERPETKKSQCEREKKLEPKFRQQTQLPGA
ncbi:hypothetical protein FN846DRAFT_908106 [Sphaerosporella brunnea]|uniref:Uncharacterized protein n=1 Tax=Sphaerosporella brunnea TaxID=1250544 RepID=A0A5J5EUJ8_9PEZI|nr:hypothetical protein FN846DRAFT_908106 [Sphaerosporella brunnea]